MLRKLWTLPLLVVLGLAPVCLAPVQSYAQNDARQQAYQAGYNNGVNDRQKGKPLNLKTDNWKGANLEAYQRGYQDGYRSAGRGYGPGPYGGYAQNDARRRAYQAGYDNGLNDRQRGKPLNLKTDNWKGQNLEAYQRGYQDGYRSAGRGYRY
jgi:ribosome modulation factor